MRSLLSVAVLLACATSAAGSRYPWPVGATARRYIDYGTGSENYTSNYRLLDRNGRVVTPIGHESHVCPYLSVSPSVPDQSLLNGACTMYLGKPACCPPLPVFWKWTSLIFANIFDDPSCARNLERLFCFFSCSTLNAYVSRTETSQFVSYLTNRTAEAVWGSCKKSCSTRLMAGVNASASTQRFLNSINIGAWTSGFFNLNLTIGFNPDTNLSADIDMLAPSGGGYGHVSANASDCYDCYVLANNDTYSALHRNVKFQSNNTGYCTQSFSETSECCHHDRFFNWTLEAEFNKTASSDCVTNIKRLHCVCLCPENAPYVQGWDNESVECYVDRSEVEILWGLCNSSAIMQKWGNWTVMLLALGGTLKSSQHFSVLAGESTKTGRSLSGIVGSREEDLGFIVAPAEDAAVESNSTVASFYHSASGINKKLVIGLAVGIGGFAAVIVCSIAVVLTVALLKGRKEKSAIGKPSCCSPPKNLNGSLSASDAPSVLVPYNNAPGALPSSSAVAGSSQYLTPPGSTAPSLLPPSRGGECLQYTESFGVIHKVETLFDSCGTAIASRHLVLGPNGEVIQMHEQSLPSSAESSVVQPPSQ